MQHGEDLSLALWIRIVADAGHRLWPGNCRKWLLKELGTIWGSMEVSSLSMEVCTISMEVVCFFWRSGWSWKEADSMLYALLVTWLLLNLDCWHLPLPLCPLDVLWDLLSPPPDCLDLHWVLKWFLLPHLWHFLPHAGHSWGGWDVPHLPHILPLLLVLALAWDPWPFLVKVLILLIVVDVATPPLDLCQWKSLMVASCCFACCNSLSKVTVSFRAVCDLTHFLTSKCFIAWKSSSSQHFIFSSVDA